MHNEKCSNNNPGDCLSNIEHILSEWAPMWLVLACFKWQFVDQLVIMIFQENQVGWVICLQLSYTTSGASVFFFYFFLVGRFLGSISSSEGILLSDMPGVVSFLCALGNANAWGCSSSDITIWQSYIMYEIQTGMVLSQWMWREVIVCSVCMSSGNDTILGFPLKWLSNNSRHQF